MPGCLGQHPRSRVDRRSAVAAPGAHLAGPRPRVPRPVASPQELRHEL